MLPNLLKRFGQVLLVAMACLAAFVASVLFPQP